LRKGEDADDRNQGGGNGIQTRLQPRHNNIHTAKNNMGEMSQDLVQCVPL
jgi:hypothetical protein